MDRELPGSTLAFGFEEGITIARVNLRDAVELGDISEAGRDDRALASVVGLLRAGATQNLSDLTAQSPWSALVDNGVVWAWNLTNNAGFDDGLQMEFIETASRRSTIVQLMAEGGTFSVRVMSL